MTVIRPNSITGITSITALNDTISVYKSDGTTAGLQLDGVNFSTTGVSTVGQLNVGTGGTVITTTAGGLVGLGTDNPARKLDVVDSGANGSVIRSRVTTNNGGYLAYEALNSSGSSVFSVTHNGRINLSENIVLASGYGIDFSATANGSGTMTSELLNDYEEGTWTPTYTAGVNSPSYTGTSGTYTKIGRLVTFCLRIQLNSGTGNTSQLAIGSLPFFEMGGPTGGAVINYNGGLRTDGNITCHVGTGTNVITFFQYDGSTFNGNEANNILGTLHINGFYFT